MQSSPENEGGGERQDQPPQAVAEADVQELREQNAQLEDRYKRALADLDNYRKRSARETERRIVEERDRLERDWLDAVDAVERALRMDVAPENPVAEGLRHVLEQMEAILARHGIQRVGSAGERFDPERHEAVSAVDTDEVPDRTVMEVARSGFAAGDRVIRPAQVVVARGSG
ncbi:MAG: molecular chaperone GrpE [Thermoleophilales bacterium]|jgi:molecular chaperone GrpE|nr:molecular chaperone GrpE [Thermoleophilales bacterium]